MGRSVKDELAEEARQCAQERQALLQPDGSCSASAVSLPNGAPPFRAPLTMLEAFSEAQQAEKERSGQGSGAGIREGRPHGIGKPGSEVFSVPDRHTQPFLAYCEEFFRDIRMCDARLAPSSDPLTEPAFAYPHFAFLSPPASSAAPVAHQHANPLHSDRSHALHFGVAHTDTRRSQHHDENDDATAATTNINAPASGTRSTYEQRNPSDRSYADGNSAQHSGLSSEASLVHESVVIAPPKLAEGESMDELCQVCWDGTSTENNPILLCEGCGAAVHKYCYGIRDVPLEEEWYCLACAKENQDGQRPQCVLCPSSEGALARTTQAGQYAHLFCAQWVPETCIHDEPTMCVDRISSVHKQRWSMRCSICKQNGGACVQCAYGKCTQAFHPICARRQQVYRLELLPKKDGSVAFKVYCDRHAAARAKAFHSSTLAHADANSQQQQETPHSYGAGVSNALKNQQARDNSDDTQEPINGKWASKQRDAIELQQMLNRRKSHEEYDEGHKGAEEESADAICVEQACSADRDAHSLEKDQSIQQLQQHRNTYATYAEANGHAGSATHFTHGDTPAAGSAGLSYPSDCAQTNGNGAEQRRVPNDDLQGPFGSAMKLNSHQAMLKPQQGKDICQYIAPLLGTSSEISAHELKQLVRTALSLGFAHFLWMESVLSEECAARIRAWANDESTSQPPDAEVSSGARLWLWQASLQFNPTGNIHPVLHDILSEDTNVSQKPNAAGGGWTEHISVRSSQQRKPDNKHNQLQGDVAMIPFPEANLKQVSTSTAAAAGQCAACSYFASSGCGNTENASMHCLRLQSTSERCGNGNEQSINDRGMVGNTGSASGRRDPVKLHDKLRSKECMMGFLRTCESRRAQIAQCPTDEVSSELVLHQAILARQVTENRRRWTRVLRRVRENAERENALRERRMADVNEANQFLSRLKELKKQRHKATAPAVKTLQEGEEIEDKAVEEAAQDEDASCVVCGCGDSEEPNEVLFCERCELAVHQRCYGVRYVPRGDWLCDPCHDFEKKERENNGVDIPSRPDRSLRTPGDGKRLDPRPPCKLCPVLRGAMKPDLDAKDPGNWMHIACALSHGETCHSATAQNKGITGSSRIPAYAWGAKCGVCGRRSGACVRCSEEGCNISVHPLCARNAALGFYVQRASDGNVLGADVRCHEHLKREDSMEQPSPGKQQSGDGESKRKRKVSDPVELQHAKYARHDFDRLRLLCTRMLKREYTMRANAEATAAMASEALHIQSAKVAADSLEAIWPAKHADASWSPLTHSLAQDLVQRLKSKRQEYGSHHQGRGRLIVSRLVADEVNNTALPSGMAMEPI